MVPAYKNATEGADAPLDILFLNLSNWPGNPVYPYAFVQVSALARRAGLSIRRWDGLGLSRAQQLACITDLVRQHRPRAVGFTVRQADSTLADDYIGAKTLTVPGWFPLEDTRAAIERVRELSAAKILVGGFTFTVNPVSAAKYLEPDFGVVGEPDDVIAHFDEIMAGRTEGIANLLYRQDGEWRQNERVYYGPLDALEYTPEIIDEIVAFHGERTLRETHLAAVPGLNTADDTGRAIAVEISRGCPCQCAFCCEPLVKGRTLRLRDLDVVEAEVKGLLRHGLRYFWFVCSELTFTKAHVLDLAERLIRINRELELPIYWRAYFLPVKFDKDEFRILLRSGLMLEQNGPFSDLSNETLAQMHEPYRVKHALAHIRDLMELNEEPEFAHRRMDRWILWSWLANPYATRESVRQTLETFASLGLDLHYDAAEGYPALRVYEGLRNLPEDTPQRTEIVTGDRSTAKSIIHPAFCYSHDLLAHFGDVDRLHDFLFYAHETLLSRHYRATRDWLGWSLQRPAGELTGLLAPITPEPLAMPPWVDHPELTDRHPAQWYASAYRCWEQAGRDWERLRDALEGQDQARSNAMIAALLHQGFAHRHAARDRHFVELGLMAPGAAAPLESPYGALTRLLPRFADEEALCRHVTHRHGEQAAALLRYYLYALNLRLRPELRFLASAADVEQAA
ncbi:hypothetical protein [uncultured Thiohalocapsa sp.]|uniref:B12-binding domain-containing radical SAM protein n=1 Tax=uncultured Thiohalocapsa sp. TaxID=768990 RepID=UPI0025DA5DCC|nr:hypothetical protein [uncultured Thiohalocapsa sp.]